MTAGYSGTPLLAKLGLKDGMKVALVNAPPDVPIPGGRLRPGLDLVVFFTVSATELRRRWPALTGAMVANGAIWVAWPKKASKVPTDMTEHVVREVVLPTGWVDVKVCAIDETWSGLKCVLRVERRTKK